MTDRNEIKTLLLDMELSYAIYYAFPSKREQYLSAKNIIHNQFCICAAWKWHHQASKHVVKITDDKKRFKANFRDDYIVAVKLHELMTEADVIVAHNGDAFDIKHANNLFIKHGLGPIPEKKSIDTLKAARKYFNFVGNDLDSLSKKCGGIGKIDKPDWRALTEGNEKEINKAARYCLNDVEELERVFIWLRPYIRKLPALATKGGIKYCLSCGSKRIHRKGIHFNGTQFYLRIRCEECGHEMKGKADIK